jgi:DedD protein
MTVRDAERFKDKIEVSLDSRQIFFLFFGGAVVACLVFVLGVMVGRRLEQRERVAHKAATSAAVDPLAALDELGADEAKAEELLAAPAPASVAAAVPVAAPVAAPVKPETAPPAPRPAAKPEPPKPEPPRPEPPKSAAKPETKPDPAGAADAGKKKYTLQISSFQERAEADALVARLTAAGYRPFVVVSVVPDKGTFFRVRMGEYASRTDAQGAKAEFEKKEHIIAYVTKM